LTVRESLKVETFLRHSVATVL